MKGNSREIDAKPLRFFKVDAATFSLNFAASLLASSERSATP
jgi:hypothetical protein